MNTRFILKTLSLLILILANVIFTAVAQNKKTPLGASKQAKTEDAKLLKDRILVVGQYGNQVTDERIKKNVKEFWKYNSEVVFSTSEAISNLVKSNAGKYAVLMIDLVNVYKASLNPGPANQFIRFSITLGEKFDDKRPVFYQDVVPEVQKEIYVLNQREIIFAISCIQNHLTARSEGKNRMFFTWEMIDNSGKLETKTLLVDEKILAKGFTPNNFKENYPFAFEITDVSHIEKALLNKDKKYAYVELVPTGTSSRVLTHYVVDCENGQVISYGEFFNGAFDRYSNLVNDEQVKCYAKNSVLKKKKK
jgi:hypothetical protein